MEPSVAKRREYTKRDKTEKYKTFKDSFDKKFKVAVQKYLDKNVEECSSW